MDDAKAADKVQKLVRLATSPVEHEATLAARRACALIRERDLVVIDNETMHGFQKQFLEDRQYIKVLEDERVASAAQIAELKRALEATRRALPAPRVRPPARFVSRFAGHCKTCGDPYDVGDLIYWRREIGAWHIECDEPEG